MPDMPPYPVAESGPVGRRLPIPGRSWKDARRADMTRDEVEELFDRYGPLVLRRARAILGTEEEARDAMQDVFMKILEGSGPTDGPMAAWLARVTTNLCLNRVRDHGRRRELARLHLGHRAEGEEASAEDRLTVRHLLAETDERTARAAVCVHVDGMSYDEAADTLGVSKRTVANLLKRFREHADRLLVPLSSSGGEPR